MYLWKCWRDTRVVLAASLLCIGALFVFVLRHNLVLDRGPFEFLPNIFPVLLIVQAFPLSFVAWLLGFFGVGRDLGERSGSYLFTRPRSRAYFVWCDWGVGMAVLLPIVAFLALLFGALLHRIIVALGDPLHGSVMIAGSPVTLTFIVWLNFVAAFLLAGLVFSLTYFSTVLVKHAKGHHLWRGRSCGLHLSRASRAALLAGNTSADASAAGICSIASQCHRNFKPPGSFSGHPCCDHPALSVRDPVRIAEDGYRSMNAALI